MKHCGVLIMTNNLTEEYKKTVINSAIKDGWGGNKSAFARALGVSVRTARRWAGGHVEIPLSAVKSAEAHLILIKHKA